MASHEPDVELEAGASASELHVIRMGGRWELSDVGRRPRRETRRKNLPPQAREGESYTEAELEVHRAADIDEAARKPTRRSTSSS